MSNHIPLLFHSTPPVSPLPGFSPHPPRRPPPTRWRALDLGEMTEPDSARHDVSSTISLWQQNGVRYSPLQQSLLFFKRRKRKRQINCVCFPPRRLRTLMTEQRKKPEKVFKIGFMARERFLSHLDGVCPKHLFVCFPSQNHSQ